MLPGRLFDPVKRECNGAARAPFDPDFDAPAAQTRRQTRGFALAAAALVLTAGGSMPSRAATVRLPEPAPLAVTVQHVATVPFSVEDIIGIAGQEAAVELTLPSAEDLQQAGAETGSFLLIRNVPNVLSFSAGMSTGRVWVVPLREAANLRLMSQPVATGSFRLEFSLIGPGNRVLAVRDTPVELRSSDVLAGTTPVAPKPTAATAAPEPAPRPAAVQPSKPIAKEEEARLLQRANNLIKEGALSEARLILKWLADRGSGAGALALARSYDEAFVTSQPALGVRADMKEARRWYERAAELQNAEAKKRLSELPSR